MKPAPFRLPSGNLRKYDSVVPTTHFRIECIRTTTRAHSLESESSVVILAATRVDEDSCLVLDVSMPGLDGLALQRRLGEIGGSLPIVFLTGHGDIPMSVTAMKSGAIEFLTKPFREQALLDAINAGIEKDRLKGWTDKLGWETLLNRAGTTFKKLPDADKENITEKKAIALMLAQPSMIKRPVLEAKGKLTVGFRPEEYQKLFG